MAFEIPAPSLTFDVTLDDGAKIAVRRHGSGTGHLLQIEKPDECVRLTLEFLGKRGLI